jgi:hypothetical protein
MPPSLSQSTAKPIKPNLEINTSLIVAKVKLGPPGTIPAEAKPL